MKKKLIGIMCLIGMLAAEESEGTTEQIQALTGHIDGSIKFKMDEGEKKLSRLIENLEIKNCLLINGSWLREILEIRDPFVRNWAGQYFANLILSNSKNNKGAEFLFMSSSNAFVFQNALPDDENDARLNVQGCILNSQEQYLSSDLKEKQNKTREGIKSTLDNMYNNIFNSDKLNLAQKLESLSIILPDKLIENIIANNRVFISDEPDSAGMATTDGQTCDPAPDKPASSSSSCSFIDVFHKLLDDIKQYALDEKDPTLKANLTSWLDRISYELTGSKPAEFLLFPGPVGKILNNFYKAILNKKDPELKDRMIQGIRFIRFILKGIIAVSDPSVPVPYVPSVLTAEPASAENSLLYRPIPSGPYMTPRDNADSYTDNPSREDSLSPAAIVPALPLPELPVPQQPVSRPRISSIQRSALETPPPDTDLQPLVPEPGLATVQINSIGEMLYIINDLFPITSHGVLAFNPDKLIMIDSVYHIPNVLQETPKTVFFENVKGWSAAEHLLQVSMAEKHYLGNTLSEINKTLNFQFNNQPVFGNSLLKNVRSFWDIPNALSSPAKERFFSMIGSWNFPSLTDYELLQLKGTEAVFKQSRKISAIKGFSHVSEVRESTDSKDKKNRNSCIIL